MFGPLAHCVESYMVRWWASFFASSRMNHRQHPGVIRSAVVAYAGFFYVVNGLQYHTPNPYKIAFSSFTIRVRISCSSVLQSKSRR